MQRASRVSTVAALLRGVRPQGRFYVRLLNMTPEQVHLEVEKSKKGEAVSSNPDFEGWSSNLASTSESVIKAEQSNKKSFDQMQKESIEVLKKKDAEQAFPMQGTEVENSKGDLPNVQGM
jgi:hypothetical protein